MRILTTYKNGRLTLFLRGELDHHEAKEAMQRINRVIDEYLPRDCAIEMSRLDFMDSSGIALILRTSKRLTEMGGRIWIENPSEQARRVIDASGIERIIRVTQTAGGKEN